MKGSLIFTVLVAVACADSVKPALSSIPRHFIPEENNPYRIKYYIHQFENGTYFIEDLTRPMARISIAMDDVKIYLYTPQYSGEGKILGLDNTSQLFDLSHYNPAYPNYFIIHGLNNDYQSSVNNRIKNAILKKTNANIFVIDWHKQANLFYLFAKSAVPYVGEYVGMYINEMMHRFHLTPDSFHLIGHSLGAHAAGCAGAKVNGLVKSIIGLDPAGPLYTFLNTDNRLDKTDGSYVQVIHTSLLGFGSSIGHSDFYPNGGLSQKGCGSDLIGICAHSRAYKYYEESILLGGFSAVQCDGYFNFNYGNCNDNKSSYFGRLDMDYSAFGDFYLDTNSEPIFSVK